MSGLETGPPPETSGDPPWLGFIAAVAMTALFALALAHILQPLAGPDLAAVTAGTAVLTGTILFLLPPLSRGVFAPGPLVAVACFAGALALLLSMTFSPSIPAPTVALGNALIVSLMAYLLGVLGRLLSPQLGSGPAALSWLAFLWVLAGASPIWLGPLMDWLVPGPVPVDLLIGLNPLTHLSVLSETDYLRNQWFYRLSPLGSMRYDYPAPSTVVTGYLVACVAATLAARRSIAAGNERASGLRGRKEMNSR